MGVVVVVVVVVCGIRKYALQLVVTEYKINNAKMYIIY